jgi:hypothetical protein
MSASVEWDSAVFAALIAAMLLVSPLTSQPKSVLADEFSENEEKAKGKIEKGFYERIGEKIANGATEDHNIVVGLKRNFTNHDGSLNDAKENKDNIEKELLSKHSAKNIHKLKYLSFVYADVPIREIIKIAEYDYVTIIGDGTEEGLLMGGSAPEIGVPERPSPKGLTPPFESAEQTAIQPDENNLRGSIRADGTGYEGDDVIVAVIDTGIRQDHPDLPIGSTQVIINQADCTVTPCQEYNSANFAVADGYNHGTAVAGVIAAQGTTYHGVAMDAKLLNININKDAGKIPQALDWAIDNDADVANISIGSYCFGWHPSIPAADEAVEKGLIVTAPSGLDTAITYPGCGFNVITTGALDDKDNTNRADDVLVMPPTYSNDYNGFGPVEFDGRVKPDLVAPAYNIWTTVDYGTGYDNLKGSSFASAATAGAVAQLLEKNPTWNPAQVKAALKQTAYLNANLSPLTENQRGKGIVDVDAALDVTTATINYAMAYGFDVNTFIVEDLSDVDVQYKFGKETAGSNIGSLFIQNGKVQEGTTGTLHTVFKKLSFPGIKIGTASQTLTDSKLFAGPRVDYGEDYAFAYVKYVVGSDTVTLAWFVQQIDIQPFALFVSGSGSKTFEAVQYLNVDLGTSITNDKATPASSPYTPYQYEKKFTTGTNFHLRDNTATKPWMRFFYQSGTTVTEWILKYSSTQPPINTPDSYYSIGDCIDGISPPCAGGAGDGDNILIYYRGSATSTSVAIGPELAINYTIPP